MHKTRYYFISILLLISVNVFADNLSDSYKNFGHLPMIQYPVVSPDGKYIAAVLNSPDGPSIVLSAFGSGDLTTIAKLKKSQDRFDQIQWANNERLIISASYSKKYLNDFTRVNRLYAVNIDGSNFQLLANKKNRKRPAWMDILSSSRIVSLLDKEPEYILLQLYDELDNGWSVFKVNIYENKFKKLFVNQYDVSNWYANSDGEVVFGVQYDGSSKTKDTINIWHRDNNEAEWKMLHSRKMFESSTFDPIMVKGDKAIVLTDYQLDRKAMWLYDIPSGEFDKVLYSNDKYDVDGGILSPDGREVIGAIYFDHYRQNHFFNEDDAKVYSLVKNSFKKYHATIADFSLDRKKVLVWAQRDNTPPKYFWLDIEKSKGGYWFSSYPYLEKNQLANVQPFEFDAKDGMKLNGYLTLPVASNKKPPLVVFPHGGPQSRDYQYFNPYVQYFAEQGYAVLQVNFRGSTGFGNDYETKGYREWGHAMQQDVYDAFDWLVTQDVVDTDNSCLVGASYGGYVALTAAFQKPKMFKCIVSIAGVSDVEAIANNEYKYSTLRAFVEKTIGNPKNDEDVKTMRAISPVNHVKKIREPILLIHGTHDTQVPVKQSREFYKRAKRAGIDIETVEYKYGTHYLDENNNRLATFDEMGSFLRKHLK